MKQTLYIWRSTVTLPERFRHECLVLARDPGRRPRNVLVQFWDGFRAVAPRFCVRRKKA
jgi:hypothetical protein